LAKVPVSVTAMSQKTLDDLDIETIADLASAVPGLVRRVGGAGQMEQSDLAIRGVVNNSGAPTTGVYVDETPIELRNLYDAATGSPEPHIFDLERVEVLRGPQGTLFGSSAEGGAIRFITPQPSLDTYSGYSKAELSFTQGGDPSYEVGLAYGGPIVAGTAGFRVSGWFRNNGGYLDREDPVTGSIVARNANDGTAFALRPAMRWAPSDRLSITLAAFVQQDDQHDPAAYWLDLLPNTDSARLASGYAARRNVNDLTVPSLSIQYDFSNFTLQSDTSYLYSMNSHTDDFKYLIQELLSGGHALIPGNPPYSGVTPTYTWNRAWQQEIRLSSKDNGSHWQWVLGLFFRRSAELGEQFIEGDLSPVTEAVYGGATSFETFGVANFNTAYGPVSYSQSYVIDEQKSVFGEVNYEITQGLHVLAGARIERSTVSDAEFYYGPLVGIVNASIPKQSETPFTPRFGINYQFNDNNMVYATAAKGFREGGGNSPVDNISFCAASLAALGLKSVPPVFDSDSVWSYELGAKSLLMDRRLSVEASVYYINWTQIQQSVLEPACGESFTTNEGAAVSQGFDLQFAAQVTDRLKVGGLVGYTDAYFPRAVPAVTGNLENAGDRVQGVLPWTAAVNVEYRHEMPGFSPGSQGYLRADFRWLDGQPAQDPTLATFVAINNLHRDPAYDIVNLRAGINRNGWDVSLFINNAANSNPVVGFTSAGNQYGALRIQPRTGGVTAYYRF
jgi:iron complex outermembrane recepter protein